MVIFPIDEQKINYRQLARINTDSIILNLYLEYPSRQAVREYEQNYVSPFFEFCIFIVLFLRGWLDPAPMQFPCMRYIVTLQLPQKLLGA